MATSPCQFILQTFKEALLGYGIPYLNFRCKAPPLSNRSNEIKSVEELIVGIDELWRDFYLAFPQADLGFSVRDADPEGEVESIKYSNFFKINWIK